MAVHHENRIVPFVPELLYAVVADVERYPEFVPGCQGLKILSRETSGGQETLRAEMVVGSGPLRMSYISRVVFDPASMAITVTQDSGPFRKLENRWRFTSVEGKTEVDFYIEFLFRNPLFEAAMGAVFTQQVSRISHAFEARAATLVAA